MADQKIVNTPENWDDASRGYAEKVAPRLMELYTDEFIDRLDVNPESEVLEVAAGSGAITEKLSKKVRTLFATDFSPKMIDLLKKRIANAGMKNVNFEVMDGQSLNVNGITFDRAICSFGLMLFPDRHKGFSELNRVLRPGGKAVVTGWAGPDRFGSFRLFLESIQKAFPDFPKPQSPPPIFSLADPPDFKAQMEAAGFSDVQVDYVEKELVVSDFNTAWEMLTVGAPPIQELFDQVGAEGKNKIHEAMREIINARYSDGPISVINTATVGTGVRE